MAKSITIMQNKISQTFSNVKKIRTNLVGEGSQNWVPEDEAADYAKIKKGSFNENGTYYASEDDKDAYNEVKVRVPSERLRLKGLKVTENGTYTAESQNVDGFNNVSVNVKGGTGGVDYTFTWEKVTDTYYDSCTKRVELNGLIYSLDINGTVYTFDGTNWGTAPHVGFINVQASVLDVYNGELHWICNNLHGVLRGNAWVYLENPTVDTGYAGSIEYNGELHVFGGYLGTGHYVYNGSTWTQSVDIPASANHVPAFVYDGIMYIVNNNKLYAFNGNSWTELGEAKSFNSTIAYVQAGDKERVHIGGTGLHYSFNGSFFRPEQKAYNGNGNVNDYCSINGVFYAFINGQGAYKATVVTANG